MDFYVPFDVFIKTIILKKEFSEILKKEKTNLTIKNIYTDFFLKKKFDAYIGKNILIKFHSKIINYFYIIFINSNYMEMYFLANAIYNCYSKIMSKDVISILITNIIYKITNKMNDTELEKIWKLNFYNIPELNEEDYIQIITDYFLKKSELEMENKYGLKFKEYNRKKEYYAKKYRNLYHNVFIELNKKMNL